MAAHPTQVQEFLDQLKPIRAAIERYAQRNAWNRQQVQDIVQEAIMTAWREYHRFEPGTDFRAWLFRILINHLYSHNKKTRRDRSLTAAVPVEEVEHLLQRETAWSSILEDPQRVLQSLDDRLVAAMDQLAGDERQCLLLRLVEGFSYKEIAVMMQIPMGTVMSHVHRARTKLRERLADMAVEYGYGGHT